MSDTETRVMDELLAEMVDGGHLTPGDAATERAREILRGSFNYRARLFGARCGELKRSLVDAFERSRLSKFFERKGGAG